MAKESDLTQQCRQLLVDHNIPITRPRIVFLEILLKNKAHLKVQDVIKLTEGKLRVWSLYRIINMLKNLNLITEFQTPENTKVIELSGIKDEHHHHIFCKSCGAVEDFELNDTLEKNLEKEIQLIESSHHISVMSHSLELFSICNRCKTQS